jgi:hypothetical protein
LIKENSLGADGEKNRTQVMGFTPAEDLGSAMPIGSHQDKRVVGLSLG